LVLFQDADGQTRHLRFSPITRRPIVPRSMFEEGGQVYGHG
jgi:hypothetical protein